MISIVMPVYNAANYLSDCLSSIIAQSEQNWELLAVDDFSEDDSLKILYDFAWLDPRIKVFKNTAKGIIPALQLAYSKSSGTFITRMDADDLMAISKLTVLKNLLLKSGQRQVATGLVKYFADRPLGNGYKNYEAWLNGLTASQRNFTQIYKECVIPSPCWMLHRTDFESVGAFHSNRYPEDYDLCFRMYEGKLNVTSSQSVLHYWRDYPERTSRNDPNYRDNRFLDLKSHYFLKLDFNPQRPLYLWGAGRKGKILAKLLIDSSIDFHWVCNQTTKIGHRIYGVELASFETLLQVDTAQLLIAVAAIEGKVAIQTFLNGCSAVDVQVFYFC